jgi:hypothetical protein
MTEIAARDIAERIRSGVAGRYFPDDALRATVKLTASWGLQVSRSMPTTSSIWLAMPTRLFTLPR